MFRYKISEAFDPSNKARMEFIMKKAAPKFDMALRIKTMKEVPDPIEGAGGYFDPKTNTICMNTEECVSTFTFVFAHEFRHLVQYKTGIMKSDDQDVYWMGPRYCSWADITRLFWSDLKAYNKLPWEEDANAFAQRFSDFKHESIDRAQLHF